MGLTRRAGAVAAAAALAASALSCSPAAPDSPRQPPPWQAGIRLTAHGAIDTGWLSRCANLRRTVESHTSARVIFIGDSITAQWATMGAAAWNATFGPEGGLNLGLSGDTTQNVLWRLGRGELKGLHPRVVVLLIGTNDIPEDWPVDDIGRGVLAVVSLLRRQLPATPVLLLSILPRGDSWYGFGASAVDSILARSTLPSQVTYLDVTGALESAAGGHLDTKLYQGDLLHIAPGGYQALAARIGPAVDRLLAVRTR